MMVKRTFLLRVALCWCAVFVAAALFVPGTVIAGHQLKGSQCYDCHNVGGSLDDIVTDTRLIKKDARVIEIINGGWATGNPLPCIYCHDDAPKSVRTNMVGVKDQYTNYSISKHPVNPFTSNSDGTVGLDCIECHTNVAYVAQGTGGGTRLSPNIHEKDVSAVGWTAGNGSLHADSTFIGGLPYNANNNVFCTDRCHDSLPGTGYPANKVAHGYTSASVSLELDGGFDATPDGCLDESGVGGCHSSHNSQSNADLITALKSGSSVYGTGVIERGDCGICHTFDDPPRASSEWAADGHGRFETTNGINCTSCHDSSTPHFNNDGTSAGNRLNFVEDPANSGFSVPAMSVLSNCVSSNCHVGKTSHSAKPVGCLDCHDIHGKGVGANIAMLRRVPPVAAPASSLIYETIGAYFDTAYAGTSYSDAVCDNSDCHGGVILPIAQIMDPSTGTHPGRPIYTGCDSCHEHNADGGSFSPSGCDSCHGNSAGLNWPDTLSVALAARPDRAGAHSQHITALNTGNSSCDTCHPVPGSPRSGTGESIHDDTSEPADVHSDGRPSATSSYFKNFLAADDANATYDSTAKTCSNIDCHQESNTPAWYSTTTPVTCTSCHNNGTDDGQLINAHPGSGLHATHVAVANTVVDDCAACHGTGANTGAQAGHWNGSATFGTNISSYANTSCTNSCHAVSGTNDWQSGASINCIDCHQDLPTDYIAPAPSTGLHTATSALAHDNSFTASNYSCNDCHNTPPSGINHIDGTSQSSTQASYSFSATNISSYTSTSGCAASCHYDSAKWSRKWISVVDAAATGNPGDPVCDNCHGDGLSNATTVDDVWRGGVVPVHQTDWDSDATAGEVLDPVSSHSTCQACHGWGNAAYDEAWGGVSPAHGDTRLAMNGPVGTGAEYDSTQRGCLAACHSGLLDSVPDANYAHTMGDSGWTLNFGDFGSGDCDTCHAGLGRSHNGAAESSTTHSVHATADGDYVAGCDACHAHDGLSVPPNTGAHNDSTVNFGGSYMTTAFNYTTTFSDASCGGAANGCHNATAGDWNAEALSDCSDCHNATGKNLFAGGGASMTQTVPPVTAKHSEHVANTAYVNACTSCHTHDGVSGTLSNHVNGPTASDITLGSQITPPLAGDNSCTNACHISADTRDWEAAGSLYCTDCHVSGASYIGDNAGAYLPVSGLHAAAGTDANNMTFVPHDETLDAARCAVCHTTSPSASHADGTFDTPPTVFDAAINYGYDSTDTQSFCLGETAGCHVDNAKLYRVWSAAADCTICHGKDSTVSIGVNEAPANDGGSNTAGMVYGHTSVATNGTATSGEHNACISCHWGTGAEDTGINDHVDRAAASTLDVAYDYSQSTGKCGTNCHGGQADTWLWDYNSTIPVNAYSKTLACGACHNDGALPPTSGSHAQHGVDADADYTECQACHGAPLGGAWDAANFPHSNSSLAFASSVTYSGGTGGTCSTTNCHSAPSNQATWGSNASMTCNECHYWDASSAAVTSAGNTGHFAPLSADHGNHFDANYYCTDCHADNSGDAAYPRSHPLNPGGTDGVVLTAKANAVQNDAAVAVSTWNDTDDTCANAACHYPSSPTLPAHVATWQTSTASCTLCHGDSGTDPATGSHTAHNTPSLSGTFGLTINCTDCHLDNTGNDAHRNGTINFIGGIVYAASSCTTTICHNNGTGTANPTPTWGTASGDCSICHAANPGTNAHAGHLTHPTYTCGNCHTSETASTHINDGVTLTGKAASYSANTALGGAADGTCATGACHDIATDIAWNVSATNCDQCHQDTADRNDFNGQDTVASEVASGEFSAVGHGSKSIACLDCHDEGGTSHSFANPVAGSNPYRLNAGFTCTDNAASCHDGNPTASVATVVTHSQPEMSTAGYSTKYSWTFAPDCVNCHDPHGDGSNLSMIGKDLFDKDAFPVAASPPTAAIDNTTLVYTDNTTGLTAAQVGYADYTGGFDSVCQECHEGTPGTSTPYAFADDTRANYTGHPGYLSAASDNPGDCSDCHKHDTAFMPSGCSGCHGGDNNTVADSNFWPDDDPAASYEDRAGAHVKHVDAIAAAATTASKNATCATCHPTPGSARPGSSDTAHSDNVTPTTTADLHQDGRTATTTYFKTMGGTNDTDATYNNGTAVCSNIDCHAGNTTPDWYQLGPPPDTAGPVFNPNGNVSATTSAPLSAYVSWNATADSTTPVRYDLYWSTDGTPLTSPLGSMSSIAATGAVAIFTTQTISVEFQAVARDAVGNTTNSNVSGSVNISGAPAGGSPTGHTYMGEPATTAVPGISATPYALGGGQSTDMNTCAATSTNNSYDHWTVLTRDNGAYICGNNSYVDVDSGSGNIITFVSVYTFTENTLIEPTSTLTTQLRNDGGTQNLDLQLGEFDTTSGNFVSFGTQSVSWPTGNIVHNFDVSTITGTVQAGNRFAWRYIIPTGPANTNSRVFFGASNKQEELTVTETPGPADDTTAPVWSGGVSGIAVIDVATGGELQVSWNTATDADTPPVTYWLYRSTDPQTDPFGSPDGGWPIQVGNTSYVDSSLTNGNTYYYGVRAENNDTVSKDRTSNIDTASGSPTASGGGGGPTDCNSCHTSHPGTGAHGTHADADTNYTECDSCHGDALSSPGGTAGATTYTTGGPSGSAHNDGSTSMIFPGDTGATAAWNDPTCAGIDCHFDNVTPNWVGGTTTCATDCHLYPPNGSGGTVNHNAGITVAPATTTNFLDMHGVCETCHGIKSSVRDGSGAAQTHANYPVGSHGDVLIRMNGPDSTPGPAAGAEYNDGNGGCENACHANNATYQMDAVSSLFDVNYADFGGGDCTSSSCHASGGAGSIVTSSSPHVATTLSSGFIACEDCHPGGTVGSMHSAVGTSIVFIPNYGAVGLTYTQSGTNGVVLGGQATVSSATEAEICWSCHDSWGISEWGVNNNASTGTITYNYGSLDQSNWVGALWSSANFSYKNSTIQSTHTANPSAMGGPSVPGVDTVGQIRCSYCHDVHNTAGTKGVSVDVDGQPYLRGPWRGNPYPEDGAPRSTNSYTGLNGFGQVPRGGSGHNELGGYQIDQNNGNPNIWTFDQFGGLCELCHGSGNGTWTTAEIDNLNEFGSPATDWVGTNGHSNAVKGAGRSNEFNVYDTDIKNPSGVSVDRNGPIGPSDGFVSHIGDRGYGFRSDDGEARGWDLTPMTDWTLSSTNDQNGRSYAFDDYDWGVTLDATTIDPNYHQFTCSKCHNPHASRLPRLMITNCLDTDHNTWDTKAGVQSMGSGNNQDGAAATSDNQNVPPSQFTSAQNCHRERDATYTNSTGDGWNNITPWVEFP